MASFFYQPSNLKEETYECDPPPGLVEIELTISVRRTIIRHDCLSRRFIDSHAAPFDSFFSQEPLCFDLDVLKNPYSFYQLLAPVLIGFGIDPTSLAICNFISESVELGYRIEYLTSNWGSIRVPLMAVFLQTVIVHMDNQEYSINRALSESALEFEASNYGMVAAKESSVKKMLNKVNVKVRDQDCMICLDELEVGLVASRMPCSHTFHDNCIKTWLKQSHYCPICRFEMPT
ncbi:hypothetical protein PTKIN_Ptkin17bG0160300 [Pterospermum kingtungense]